MQIPPNYQLSREILNLVSKIDALRLFFTSFEISPAIRNRIHHLNTLKSSLFSARIEGNPLTLTDFENGYPKDKREIQNILDAIRLIDTTVKPKSAIDVSIIRLLHATTTKGIGNDQGQFRTELSAIFNSAGIAVYVPPPPSEILGLISQLIRYIQSNDESFPMIKAMMSHLIFEKIHPFLDGNGRVGRLLVYAILKSSEYDFGFCVPFEEYLDEHKDTYYQSLDIGMKNPEEFLLTLLEAYYSEAEKMKNLVSLEISRKNEIILPPRQEEILQIIKDQRMVSFDFLSRRFLKVPVRTLHYDIEKLQQKNLVIKVGKTRGSFYTIPKQ